MRGRKRPRQRLRSAALTTTAVLMASTAAAAEPHGSPGVAGAQAQARMNSGADGTDGSNTIDSDGCHDRAPSAKTHQVTREHKSECSRQQATGHWNSSGASNSKVVHGQQREKTTQGRQ